MRSRSETGYARGDDGRRWSKIQIEPDPTGIHPNVAADGAPSKNALKKAQKDAEITVVRANAEAQAIQTQGNAIKSNPEIISLEIARRWNGQSPQSVVVGQGGANVLLPLK